MCHFTCSTIDPAYFTTNAPAMIIPPNTTAGQTKEKNPIQTTVQVFPKWDNTCISRELTRYRTATVQFWKYNWIQKSL